MSVTIGDLRGRGTDALLEQIEENTRELFNLRFQKATEKSENPGRIRMLRKEIARMKTVIRERELDIEKED